MEPDLFAALLSDDPIERVIILLLALWLDVGCNLAFAYSGWRSHQAILLLLPADRRGRVLG